MGGQLILLQEKLSTLSPEVQRVAYDALAGKGSLGYYARERKGEYLQALRYLDQFYNTAEGKRFESRSIEARTPYAQMFGQEGRENITITTPEQPKQSYIDPSGQGISVTKEELEKGISSGQIKGGGTYRDISGTSYRISQPQTTAKTIFEDYAKQVMGTPEDIARYKSMGYTQQEAVALAQYSKATRTTPTRKTAEKYLREERGIGVPTLSTLWVEQQVSKGTGKVWQTTEKYFPALTGGISTIWREAGEPMQPKELSELQRTFFIEKTGFEKLKAAPRVGFETAKYGLFGGLQATQEIGRKGETALINKGYIWTGAAVGVVSDIIPASPREAAMFYGATKAFTYIPKITKTTFTGTGVYGMTQAKTPKEYLSSGLMIGIGTAGAVAKSIGAARTLISPSKAYKIPLGLQKGTPLRQRSTILIKDIKTGKYLVHADKPTGTYMTFGGKIERGETPLKAAKRELYEESGLKLKLKYKETFYSTEQKHYVYEAIVNKKAIKGQLKAQRSEVSGFKWIKPPKYTGATALEPFGRKATRLSFDKKIVRAEDLAIISKAKYPDIVPTKLVSNIPQEAFIRRGQAVFLKQRRKTGEFFKFQKTAGQEYGFGSRYDIPYSKLKSYEGKKLTYVHGTPSRIQTQLDIISKGGMPKGFKQISAAEKFKVEEKYMKRGEKVLYFQPPTTASPLTGRGYVGVTYLGLYKKARPSYEMGISVKRRTPTIYEYKGELGKDLFPTQKAIRGKEFEAGIKTEFGIGSYSKTYLAGKKIKIIEIKKTTATKQTKQLQKSLKEGAKEEYYIKVQKRPVGVSEVISHGASRLLYSPTKYKSYRYGYTGTYSYRSIPYKTPTTPYTPYYTPYKTTYRVTPIKPPTGVPSPETYAYSSPEKLGFGIPPTIKVTSRRAKSELFPQLKPQPKEYQPSFKSRALGITASKISKSYYKGAGGITARPIIVTRKRK